MSALSIGRDAIAAIDLEARVARSLSHVPLDGCVLVAVGKAAPAMARGALSIMAASTQACVVTADGTDARGLDHEPRVTFLRAAHPIPDARSVVAAEALLSKARGAPGIVALISGGASSLACAPAEGLSLADKQAVVAAMLDAGAPIREVNLVRRHLSRFKGGGLARMSPHVHTRIVSDVLVERDGLVVPGAPHDIGSGPASDDPTTAAEARAALFRFAPGLVALVAGAWIEGRAVVEDEAIVAGPDDLADQAARIARNENAYVTVLPPSLGTVEELAHDWVQRARTMRPSEVILRVAEPSVALPVTRGRGGRAGRLALSAWALGLPDDVELACLASDGSDGSSGSAGAVVRGALAGERLARAHRALDAYDDAPFLDAEGASIRGAPSGTNLLDLHVLRRV